MKKIALLLLLCTPLLLSAQSGDYRDYLKQYFDASGSSETFKVAVKQTIGLMRGQANELDDSTWEELEGELLKASIDDLVDLLVPVYQEHFTVEDLKEIIAFYESPIGKKLSAKTPLITQASMEVGAQWGAQLGEKVAEKIGAQKY